MLPLFQDKLPTSAAGLATALDASLRRALRLAGNVVTVRDQAYPAVDEIAIDLSGATLRTDAARPPLSRGAGEPAITANNLNIVARGFAFSGAAVDFALAADDVVLHQERADDGNIVLILYRAENGHVAISVRAGDLERLITETAKTEAGRHGVVIEDVLLSLKNRGRHSLGAELRLQARKLFMRATIRITGQLDIDDELVARISGLGCSGEGATGAMACGILAPHLQKLQARTFPLLAFSLGEVQLRDINLNVDDGIRVSAEFGSTKAA